VTALRVHRIPFSTNVERIALAAAHKGVAVEWVDHAADDRAAIRELSGQELVPVAETPNGVLSDSTVILTWLEQAHPDPPLWPADPVRRAEADTFVEWFNAVWKGPPNRLAAGEEEQELYDALSEWLDRFETLLSGRDFLLGDTLGIADVVAFPFLKYPVLGLADDDADPFHRVLVETMADPGPNVRAWVARVDALPRA
jgi:glutathione S-transferase